MVESLIAHACFFSAFLFVLSTGWAVVYEVCSSATTQKLQASFLAD